MREKTAVYGTFSTGTFPKKDLKNSRLFYDSLTQKNCKSASSSIFYAFTHCLNTFSFFAYIYCVDIAA